MYRIVALLLFVLIGSLSLAQSPSTRPEKPLVFIHVTVIDATGTPPATDRTVVITSNRISAINGAGTLSLPKDSNRPTFTTALRKPTWTTATSSWPSPTTKNLSSSILPTKTRRKW